MLTDTQPLGKTPPSPPRFTWECDACEAKQSTATPDLPAGWTKIEDEGGNVTLCADCSACEHRGALQ